MAHPDSASSQSETQTPNASQSGLSRRKLLGIGSIAAAALATPTAALAQNRQPGWRRRFQNQPSGDQSGGQNSAQSSSKTPRSSRYEAFTQPFVMTATNGVLDESLRVEPTTFTYQRGDDTKTVTGRSFSNYIPAPTLKVSPGDKIKLTVDNIMTDNPHCEGNDEADLNYPSCFNTTNLHYHGLHVSPSSYCADGGTGEKVLSSDDVLYKLKPQHQHNWCVWLPTFHAPGTHWYHAHSHGSTGLQVSNGMAGTILIQEPTKALNIVASTEDKIWLMQEIVGGSDEDVYPQAGLPPKGKPGARDPFRGAAGDFLINGKYQPTLDIKAGQVQRWRFVNATATPRGLLTLKLCKMDGPDDTFPACPADKQADMYLMAVDGISFYNKPPEPIGPSNERSPKRTGWDFAPGNRADFLVKLEAGLYKLVKVVDREAQGQSTRSQILAFINVQESNLNESIPAKIPAPPNVYDVYPYLKPIEDNILVNKDAQGRICPRKIAFSREAPAGPRRYKINDQLFSPDCVNVEVGLNTAEQWELTTVSGAFHPFHIHVNPFQIVGDKIDPKGPDEPSNWRWWDTIALPKDEVVTTRNHFLDYHGVYVIHCHILIHEDQGMMFNVHVKDDGTGTPPCYSLDLQGNSEPGEEALAVMAQGAAMCKPQPLCTPPVEPECPASS